MIRYCGACKSTIAPNGKAAIPIEREKLARLTDDITDGYCKACADKISAGLKAKRAKRAA